MDTDNNINGYADLIVLTDDEGKEYEFEVVGEIDNDEGNFLALVPTDQNPEDMVTEAETYYILEVIDDGTGDPQLAEIEDDDLLNRLAEEFENAFYEDVFGEE